MSQRSQVSGVSEPDSSLATQCLDFCQALARQGKDFKLSITIGSTFTFSLDTKEGRATLPTRIQKRKSPSTLKRNAKRREEFLSKKFTSVRILCVKWFGIQPETVRSLSVRPTAATTRPHIANVSKTLKLSWISFTFEIYILFVKTFLVQRS